MAAFITSRKVSFTFTLRLTMVQKKAVLASSPTSLTERIGKKSISSHRCQIKNKSKSRSRSASNCRSFDKWARNTLTGILRLAARPDCSNKEALVPPFPGSSADAPSAPPQKPWHLLLTPMTAIAKRPRRYQTIRR